MTPVYISQKAGDPGSQFQGLAPAAFVVNDDPVSVSQQGRDLERSSQCQGIVTSNIVVNDPSVCQPTGLDPGAGSQCQGIVTSSIVSANREGIPGQAVPVTKYF